jgi:hypothetical protein
MTKFGETKQKQMKKTLLFTALTLTFFGSAQTLTQANEGDIGSDQTMFLCDSFIVNYENTTGAGVTWDYTGLAAYFGETRNYVIGDATLDPNAAQFPTSEKTNILGVNIATFYNSTATERSSQGFVFNEPTLGEVIATFDVNEAKLLEYPFSNGDSFSDAYSGSIVTPLGTSALSGVIDVTIDGQGTLELPNGVTFTDVIRLKSSDSSYTSTFAGDVVIKRTVYEYYNLSNSNLPVLILATVEINSAVINNAETIVLYVNDPLQYVGINENESIDFTVSPNPSSDIVTISGELSNDAVAAIIDQNGRVLVTSSVSNGSIVDISTFENGVYFVKITDNGTSTTKTIVKK